MRRGSSAWQRAPGWLAVRPPPSPGLEMCRALEWALLMASLRTLVGPGDAQGGGVLRGIGCKTGVLRLTLRPVPPSRAGASGQAGQPTSGLSARGFGSVMVGRGCSDPAFLLMGTVLVRCRLRNASCIPAPLPWWATCCPALVKQAGRSLTSSRTRHEGPRRGDDMTLLSSLAARRRVQRTQTTAGSHCKAPPDALLQLQSPGHLPTFGRSPLCR